MKFSFIKTPSNRKFNLQPIYYDEAKEERIERERRIRKELGLSSSDTQEDKSTFKSRIKGQMRPKIRTRYDAGQQERRISNLRLVVILIILMALFSYLLNAGYDWYSKFL
jgi:hypothetical protein